MDVSSVWFAAAPIALAIVLLTPLSGRTRLRSRLPWVGAVALLLISNTMLSQCSVRAEAAAAVDARLFPTPSSSVAVYDVRMRAWLQIAGGTPTSQPSEIRLISGTARTSQPGRGVGSGAPADARPFRLQLSGSSEDIVKLERSLELLASSRYGQAVLGDVLARDDVTLSLADDVGLALPTGHTLSTGGTAVTKGKSVSISRRAYGFKSPEVLAAMIAHELTHVAQNLAGGTAWWQWPWTTLDRETTAHFLQAIVWAELRGLKRDSEQDRNLENALNREQLRDRIRANPAYPDWLAPNFAC